MVVRKNKPPRRRHRVLAWVAVVVVALLAITTTYIAVNYWALTDQVQHVDAISASDKPATDTDGSAQNILLVGDDHRPANASPEEIAQLHSGPDNGENNTDTMMILHIPADGSSATLISLPRDSWVDIPGYGKGKLNSAFADGSSDGGAAAGARLLVKTVQNLTGLTIDHWVRISLIGFYDIAKALGPVQVCLNNAVNDPYSGADFPAGTSTLNASQALAFVRQRHGLPNGDLDRVVRQQYFLSVEAHALLSAGTLLNPIKLNAALKAIGSSIETDPGLDLLSLAAQLRGIAGGNIRSATIPISGTPTIWSDGSEVSVVEVDTAAMPAFIQSVIGTPSAYEKASAASPSSTTVTVLNGGDTNGAATDATNTLKSAGFKTTTPGNADTRATTTIEYPSGSESQAKAVAAYLPAAAVTETSSVSKVTVVLGTDGTMPSAPAAGGSSSSGSAPSSSSPAHAYTDKTCIN